MFSIITESNATVLVDRRPVTVPNSHKNYTQILAAIDADEPDTVAGLIHVPKAFAEFTGGRVVVTGRDVTYMGEPLHGGLAEKIADFVAAEKPGLAEPLCRFLDKVQANPSYRAVRGLFDWLQKAQLPIASDGRLIAWKIVNDNFTDCYTGKFDNTPGKTVEVRRNQVDEDPDKTCSYGLHFCSTGYLPRYGPSNKRVVMVAVDPADVVSFPVDYDRAKGRCCKYEVLAEVPRDEAETYFTREDYVYDFSNPVAKADIGMEDDVFEKIEGVIVVLDEDKIEIETNSWMYVLDTRDTLFCDCTDWPLNKWRSLQVADDGQSIVTDDVTDGFTISLADIKAHDIV